MAKQLNSDFLTSTQPIRLTRLPGVMNRVGLSRSSIYQRIADGTFPEPVSLGSRAVAWIEAEIEEWIDRRIHESRHSGKEGGAS